MKFWDANFWFTQIIELATSDARVKTQLFRFVDVLPVLTTFAQKKRHLLEYLGEPEGARSWPLVLKLICALLQVPILDQLIVKLAEFQVQQMAKNFIIGRDWKTALPQLLKARKKNLAFTLDILGETVFSDAEAQHFTAMYRSLIEQVARESKTWSEVKQTDGSAIGPIPPVNISLKVSALDSQMDPIAFDSALERISAKVESLMRIAMQNNVFINIDMEQYALRELTRSIFKKILSKDEFKKYRHFGIVVQAYQRESLSDVEDWIEFARQRGTPFTIRLVKGAYWDYEVIVARQNSWEPPVWSYKAESDLNYEACTRALLDAYPHIELALGSHNVRSISHALAYAEHKGLPLNALEIQMLYGMGDPFKRALTARGLRVREYDPVGEMLPGLSYLVRRLLENSANDSFLKQSFMDKTGIRELMKTPKGAL